MREVEEKFATIGTSAESNDVLQYPYSEFNDDDDDACAVHDGEQCMNDDVGGSMRLPDIEMRDCERSTVFGVYIATVSFLSSPTKEMEGCFSRCRADLSAGGGGM